MKKLFLILVFVLSILSCNREDNFSIQEQLFGSWHLDNVSQRKDAVIINLQNGGASFDFSPNQLKISGNTILANSGVFSYKVKNEKTADRRSGVMWEEIICLRQKDRQ